MSKVAIIILNWNSAEITVDCLKSLSQVKYDDFKIFLIDNGSKDGSVDVIKSEINMPNLRVVSLKHNYGFTGGNNIGFKIAKEEYNPDHYLLLNNDTIVQDNFLRLMVSSMEKDRSIGIVVPKIFFYEPSASIYYAGGYLNLISGLGEHYFWKKDDVPAKTNISKEVSFANGCSMLIKKEVVDLVGLLDDDFFANIEDVDYSYRVTKAGYKIFYEHGAVLWHREGFVSKKNVGQWFRIYLSTRNIILFQRKHASMPLYMLFLAYFSIRWILYMEVKLFLKRDFKSCKSLFYGIVDGFTSKLRYANKPSIIEYF
jgi:GT2 family glycosyltransferase